MQHTRLFASIALVLTMWLGFNVNRGNETSTLPTFLDGASLTSTLPFDWTCSTEEALQASNNARLKQRFMDMYSWRIFVATHWPMQRTTSGQTTTWQPGTAFPLANRIASPQTEARGMVEIPHWMTWTAGSAIFQPPVSSLAGSQNTSLYPPDHLTVDRLSAFAATDTDLPDMQFFVLDQNGNKVFYEIVINDVEREYIAENKLDTRQGQATFATNVGDVAFQPGQCTPYGRYNYEGAIELKLAWKVLDAKEDIVSRFIQRTVQI